MLRMAVLRVVLLCLLLQEDMRRQASAAAKHLDEVHCMYRCACTQLLRPARSNLGAPQHASSFAIPAACSDLALTPARPRRQRLAGEAARADGAAASAAEAASAWEAVLLQAEEDLEQQAERDGDRLAAARHEAGEVRRAAGDAATCWV